MIPLLEVQARKLGLNCLEVGTGFDSVDSVAVVGELFGCGDECGQS